MRRIDNKIIIGFIVLIFLACVVIMSFSYFPFKRRDPVLLGESISWGDCKVGMYDYSLYPGNYDIYLKCINTGKVLMKCGDNVPEIQVNNEGNLKVEYYNKEESEVVKILTK